MFCPNSCTGGFAIFDHGTGEAAQGEQYKCLFIESRCNAVRYAVLLVVPSEETSSCYRRVGMGSIDVPRMHAHFNSESITLV